MTTNISRPSGLPQLVQRYFTFEQRTSICLIIAGMGFFLTGIYMALAGFTFYYNGVGIGLVITGGITFLHYLLISFRSQWHYVAACRALVDKVALPVAPDPNNRRFQYFNKQRVWLTLVLVLLLLLLHGTDLFWSGCVHAALSVNSIHLISNEFRSYKFENYWQSVCQEMNNQKVDEQLLINISHLKPD